jgi:hypothetical protein
LLDELNHRIGVVTLRFVTSVFSLVLTLKLGLSINSHSPGDDRMMELEAAMGNGGSPMPSQWLYLMSSTLNLDLNRSFS